MLIIATFCEAKVPAARMRVPALNGVAPPSPFNLSATKAHRQLLVATFLTSGYLQEYLKNWQRLHENLYTTLSNGSVLIAAPHASLPAIMAATTRRGCAWAGALNREPSDLCEARMAAAAAAHVASPMLRLDDAGHALLFGPSFEWDLGGVEYLFVGFVVEPPVHWLDSLGGPKASAAASCAVNGRVHTYSYNYCMYSGAVYSYQLLKLPLLGRYAFLLKVDSDIVFHRRLTFDLGGYLVKERERTTPPLAIAHTGLVHEPHAGVNCQRGIHAALHAFVRGETARHERAHSPMVARSGRHSWCSDEGLSSFYLYGNFVAFATAFVRAPRVQALATYLYHEAWQGYFVFRWTDQAANMAFMCLEMDVSTAQLLNQNVSSNGQVLHLRGLRHHVFEHLRDDAYRSHTHDGTPTRGRAEGAAGEREEHIA